MTESDRAEIDRLLVQWEKASAGGFGVGGVVSPLAAMASKGTRAPTMDVIFLDEVANTTRALEAMHRYLANVLINSRFDGKRGYQEKGKVSRMTIWRRRQRAAEELEKAEYAFLVEYRARKMGWKGAGNAA